ncbi:N2-acetyl-L-ornithine:2-oxoglutarate 5-aminotransferase [Aureococcus anophagefferens]|nr:N2-acetyl-L-ornithine:2-oxoglutarate 5-aminotransferase [Aureococcus anophagefferens]
MRWAARAALLVASVRASMTWEEAQCVVAGRRIAFFGDSLSRFCYFGFNTFLATGEVRDHEFDVSEGDGENSNDYDSFDTWNDNGLVSDGKNHRMHLRKDFAEYGAHTEYYFIQNVWYDDLDDTPLEADVEIGDADNEGFIADIVAGDETIRSISLDLDADVVVFNMGWWVLKHKYVDYDCGEKWDSKCADWYEEMMDLVVENLLVADGRVGVYRTTSCCGEKLGRKHKYSTRLQCEKPDDEYDLWIDSIEAMNDVGSRVASAAGASVVDIFPLYGLSDLPSATFDMKHANVASCHEWNELILRAVDDAAGTACFPPAPTPRPSREPTYAPSYAPTAPSYAPTAAPTAQPTPAPSPAPTPRPSAAPSPTKAPVFAPTPAPVLSPTAAPVATSPRPTAAPAPAPTPLPGSPRSPSRPMPAPVAPEPAPVAPSPAPVAPTPSPVVSAAAAATATDAAAGGSDDDDDDDIEARRCRCPRSSASSRRSSSSLPPRSARRTQAPAQAGLRADDGGRRRGGRRHPVESDDAPFSPTKTPRFAASAAGSPADRLRRLRQDSLEGTVSRQALDDHLVELIDHLDHTTALAARRPAARRSWSAPDGVSVQVEMAADPPAPPADLSPMNVVVEDPFTDDEDDHEAHIHLDEPTSPLPSHVLARLAEKPRAAGV